MHDPLLYEARRGRLLFVVLLLGLGLAAFVFQGPSASDAETRVATAGRTQPDAVAEEVAAAPSTSSTVVVDLEAPATLLVSSEDTTTTSSSTTTTTTAPPTTEAQRLVAPPTTQAPPPTAPPTTRAPSNTQTGSASWYEGGSSSGCAHLTLPKGTVVTVTSLSSGRSVTCTVDDRGPYGRFIIDLSPSAFQALAPLSAGVISVRISW